MPKQEAKLQLEGYNFKNHWNRPEGVRRLRMLGRDGLKAKFLQATCAGYEAAPVAWSEIACSYIDSYIHSC